jgi:hypothetical protein
MPDAVRTIEQYPSAFCTFRLASFSSVPNPFTVGLVDTNNENTFAFAFQFNASNALFAVVNQSGATALTNPYNADDVFSVIVTNSTYQLLQNGIQVAAGSNNVAPGGSYYLNFFLPDPNLVLDLISFGYQSVGATGPTGP